MRKKSLLIISLMLILVLTSCTKSKTLVVEDVHFVSYDDRNLIQFSVDKDKSVFLYIGKISGLQNKDEAIQPEIIVELTSLQQRRTFLGEKISTSSTGIESSTFPLGQFPEGVYTLKIIVRDRIADHQFSTTKSLIIS